MAAEGEPSEGRRLLERVLGTLRALRFPTDAREALCELGWARRLEGDRERARESFAEVLQEIQAAASPQQLFALEGLAVALADAGEGERAARLLGSASAERDRRGLARSPRKRALVEPALASARESLGARAFERALKAGAKLTWKQACAEALAARPAPAPPRAKKLVRRRAR
jgi:hypothetical protein